MLVARSSARDGRARTLSYLGALAIGLALALWCVPLPLLLGGLPAHGAAPDVDNDLYQHLTGQIYFLAQPWHRPLLVADRLDLPGGTSIALMDGIPLQALLLKALHPLAPSIRQGISAYQAFLMLMQPVAAVFALRSLGERRIGPALAVAIMAASMPTFLMRMWHSALDSHYLLLIAIGLYFRATRAEGPSRGAPAALALLCVATLLIHPYLMVMIAAILAAVPLTLLLRRGDGISTGAVATGLAATIAAAIAIVLLGAVFGFSGTGGRGGFGLFSMNLLAPLYPARSTLLPFFPPWGADATGGQRFEGYQYLGLGLIVALVMAVCSAEGRRAIGRFARGHRGLLVVVAGLAVYALSNLVCVGPWRMLAFPDIYPAADQLRASGRLFWPAAYLLLIGAVLLLARRGGRSGAALLAACALAQAADASFLRNRDRRQQQELVQPDPAGDAFAAALRPYRAMVIAPRLECVDGLEVEATPLLYQAALQGMTTNTAYTARSAPANACHAPGTDDGETLRPGEAGLPIGPRADAIAERWRAQGALCRLAGGRTLCALPAAPATQSPQP